jgi:uncharacterized membrane protein
MNLSAKLIAAHRFLRQHLFYPLALSSLLACAILAARIVRIERFSFMFMVWNLILAWIPYLLSLGAVRIQQRWPGAWWLLLPTGAMWLLFFPNAPYIMTDFLHLRERPPVPLWYDLGLLAAFAWSGFFLAVASLQVMQRLVRRVAGATMSWLFVLCVVGLSGIGVYLGRFERWNSWDIVFAPHAVVADVIRPLLAPLHNAHTLGAMAMYAALLFVSYVMFIATQPGERAAQESLY